MIFKPKLDNFTLELIDRVETAFEKNIVSYDVPFASGATLDDLGVKARKFQLRTIWRKDNYELHRTFLDYVMVEQINTLIHPELGIVCGRVSTVNAVHDDRRRCAEISFGFIEDKNPDAIPAYNPSLEAAIEDSLIKTMSALQDIVAGEFSAAGIDVSAEIDPESALVGQIDTRTFSARALIAQADQAIMALRRYNNNILNRVDSAVGMANYAATLPGAVIGAVAYAVERAALIAESAGNTPVMFVSALRSNVARLKASAPMLAGKISIAASNIAALFTGKLFVKDEAHKRVVRRAEDAPQRHPDGTPLKVPPSPKTLTANELDESLAQVRGMLRDGIGTAREMGSVAAATELSKQIDCLTRYVNSIKLERDRIITVEVEDPTPLHLICLRHGLPYTYADRIVTINNFRNPTFCLGEVKLYDRRG